MVYSEKRLMFGLKRTEISKAGATIINRRYFAKGAERTCMIEIIKFLVTTEPWNYIVIPIGCYLLMVGTYLYLLHKGVFGND